MVSRLRITILFASLFCLFFAVPPASAHRPDQGNDAGVTEIPNITTSYAYYRELGTADRVHIYRFEAEAGQFLHAGINLPQLARLKTYGVSMALIGPGLPPVEMDRLPLSGVEDHEHEEGDDHAHDESGSGSDADLSFLQASDLGGIIVESEIGDDFFEPFTQTRYWGRQVLELDLPESGTYALVIWNPQGAAGKYVLDTGTAEVFGPLDLFRFPVWWVQPRVYFEQTPQLIGFALVVLGGLTGLIFLRRRRRGRAKAVTAEPAQPRA